MQIACPNCGCRLDAKIILSNPGQKQAGQRFESIVPPPSIVGQFWHFMVRGRRFQRKPTDPHIIVRSETKTSPHQILINQLKLPITVDEARELARVYLVLNCSWSRESSTVRAGLSQTKHNKLAASFVALKFLQTTTNNRYELTASGRRFLSHYLPVKVEGIVNERLEAITER